MHYHFTSTRSIPIGQFAIFRVLAAAAAVTIQSGAAVAQSYSVNPITFTGASASVPYALNDGGAIGGAGSFSGSSLAFLWTPSTPNGTAGTLKKLALPSGYNTGAGYAVNNLGDVAGRGGKRANNGTWTTFPHSLLWPNVGAVQITGPAGGKVQSEGLAINDSRQIVMWQPSAGTGKSVGISMVINGSRQIVPIGDGYPGAINASGQVTVRYGVPNGGPGFLWTPNSANGSTGAKTFIEGAGPLAGLNDLGQVATSKRQVYLPTGVIYNVAALYLPSPMYGLSAGLSELGHPGTPPPSGEWLTGQVGDVNNSGVAIGTATAYDLSNPAQPVSTYFTVTVWDSINGMRDLNNVLAGSGWRITNAIDVNNVGQILAKASFQGGAEVTVMLNPM